MIVKFTRWSEKMEVLTRGREKLSQRLGDAPLHPRASNAASDNPDRRTSQQQQRYKLSAAGGGASGGGQGSQHQQRKTWRNGEWQLVPPHRRQSGTGLDLGAGSSTGSGTGTGAAHDSAWQRNGREDDQWFQNNPYYTLAELPADDWHEDQDDPSLRPVSDDDDDRMSVGTPSLSLPVRPGPLSYSQAASPSLGNREDTPGSVEPVSSKQPVQGEPGNSMVKPRGRPKDSDLLPELGVVCRVSMICLVMLSTLTQMSAIMYPNASHVVFVGNPPMMVVVVVVVVAVAGNLPMVVVVVVFVGDHRDYSIVGDIGVATGFQS
nr:hypothetical protein BaRGS_002242 [Batillaria attramentaria]